MATAKKKAITKKSGATKKTAAAKAKSSKTTKKVVKASATKPVQQLSKFELLRRFHLFSAAISVVIAVAAVFLLNDQTANFTTPYSAKDPIASVNETVLGQANESVATIEVKYLVAKVFGVSAVLSLLLATLLRRKYEAGVVNSTSGIRWIAMGVSSALVLELVSVLAGVQDIVTLKLIAGLILLTTLLSWMAERDNKALSSPKWAAYVLSLFTGFLAWLPLIAAIVGTYALGSERFGWHVYALVVLVLAGFIGFARNLYRYIKYPKARAEYIFVEEKYLSNELFVKVALAAVVFIALIK
jgi:hypothetical protein